MKFTEKEIKLIKRIEKNNQAYKYTRYIMLVIWLVLGLFIYIGYSSVFEMIEGNNIRFGPDYIQWIAPCNFLSMLIFWSMLLGMMGAAILIRWNGDKINDLLVKICKELEDKEPVEEEK